MQLIPALRDGQSKALTLVKTGKWVVEMETYQTGLTDKEYASVVEVKLSLLILC